MWEFLLRIIGSIIAWLICHLFLRHYLPNRLKFNFIASKIRFLFRCIDNRVRHVIEHPYFKTSWIALLIAYMICSLAISCMGYTMVVARGENAIIALYKPILVMTCAYIGYYFNYKLMKT